MGSDDVLGGYRERLDRLGAGYRGEREKQDQAFRATLAAEEERVLRHLDGMLGAEGRERSEAFRREMEEIAPAPPNAPLAAAPGRPGPESIGDLDVRSLHRLARLDSALRHSIVESCLMNLRSFASALDERAGDDRFLERVARQVGLLPSVAKQVCDFFSRPIVMGLALKDLLPPLYKVALAAIRGVLGVVDRFRDPASPRPPVSGRELAKKLDHLARSLAEVRQEIEVRRVSLVDEVRDGVEAMRPEAEAGGAELVLTDLTASPPRLFLARGQIANAVAELIRNALRHAFEPDAADRRIRITVADAPAPSTEVHVLVEDSGRGLPDEVARAPGRRGVSTTGSGDGLALVLRSVEEHLGRLEVARSELGGALVRLVILRRPALAD